MAQKLLKPSTENIPEVTTVSIRTLRDATSITTSSPSSVINWSGLDYVRLNLTQDQIIGFTGATKDGQQLVLALVQAGTIPHRVAYMSSVRLGTDIFTEPVLSEELGKLDRIIFMYDAVADKYDLVGYSRGF